MAEIKNDNTEKGAPNGSEPKKDIAPIVQDAEIKGFKGFIKGYKPMILSSLTVFAINLIFSLFGLLNMAFSDEWTWVGIVLYILFLGAYGVFLFLSGKSTSHAAYNFRRLNRVNLNAGRTVPVYKKRLEYRPYKGYLVGLFGSIPLIVLCLLALVLKGGAYDGLAIAMRIMYSLFFTPLQYIDKSVHVASFIYGAVLNIAVYGISYQIYGIKMQMQQDMIEDDIRRLHGEFDRDGSDKIDV